MMNINNKVLIYIFILLMCWSCSDTNTSKEVAFYHWKSNADFNDSYRNVLKETKAKKIYLHYFDVDISNIQQSYNDEIFPNYVINNVSEEFLNYEIIPVVYITNNVFTSNNLDISDLSNKIVKLVNQISENYFGKKLKTVQIDCDWTQTTKNLYFNLLQELKSDFTINVTIRLHQIKFPEITGIPPVKNGTLMLYNVGKLNDEKQNSILENNIVKQYINTETNYPLSLDVALPIFSQTVIKNNDGDIKLINHSVRNTLENDKHFKQIDNNNYQVVCDTLFNGFYLSKGYKLKVEEISELEIIQAYKTLENSKLNLNSIVFYHLNEQELSTININKIVNEI